MEPMITGSPSSYDGIYNSPNTANKPNQSFLPNYLLGHRNENVSATENLIFNSPSSQAVRPNLRVTWSPVLDSTNYYETNNSSIDTENYYNMSKRSANYSSLATTGGPPTASFMDSLCGNNVLNGSVHGIDNDLINPSENENDNNANIDGSKIVTVFGFTGESLQNILHHFAQCGTILAHETANKCNWVHIKYGSKLQAKKALDRNGRIFNNNMKIGVEQCKDDKVIVRLNRKTENKEAEFNLSHSIPSSPPLSNYDLNSSKGNFLPSINAQEQNQTRANMRSLTSYTVQASSATDSEHFLSKAKSYIFGW